jgi:hypothetical protein
MGDHSSPLVCPILIYANRGSAFLATQKFWCEWIVSAKAVLDMADIILVCTKAAKQGAGGICNTMYRLLCKNLDNVVRNETKLGTPGQTIALVFHHVDHRPSAEAPDASDMAFVIRIKRTWTLPKYSQ